MNKLTFLLLSISMLVACSEEKKPSQPNIIILFCDDLGYGDLGNYGHPTIRTPELDRMANDGMKFTNFYAGAPACTASRYALLTGKYPVRSGFSWVLNPGSSRGIHPDEETLAESLKAEGYATACFGKWHLGTAKPEYHPLENGFDEYLGLPYSNDMIPPKFTDIALLDGRDTVALNPDQRKLTRSYTERAISFLEKNKEGPFFIYLPYAMPHVPLYPGEHFAGQSERGTYGDVVEEIDWSIGAIRKALNDAGLSENTLVFFTSDNGPWLTKNTDGGSAGLLRDGKGSTWEGGMRVPAIALWEGRIPSSSVCTQPLSVIDLFNTCTNLAGHSSNDEKLTDGQNFSNLLFSETGSWSERTLFYYGVNHSLMAVRKGKWKLHVRTYSQLGNSYFEKEMPLLFDLSEDPSEKYELSEKHPEIVEELLAEIEKQKEKINKQPNFFELAKAASSEEHFAFGKEIELDISPNGKYGTGDALVNGIKEDADDYIHLPGFQGESLEAVIDLGEIKSLNSISIGFIRAQTNWIFLPEKVSYYLSADGDSFLEVGNQITKMPQKESPGEVKYFQQNVKGQRARWVKVVGQNRGKCPDWHSGTGQDCWIFPNEITVK